MIGPSGMLSGRRVVSHTPPPDVRCRSKFTLSITPFAKCVFLIPGFEDLTCRMVENSVGYLLLWREVTVIKLRFGLYQSPTKVKSYTIASISNGRSGGKVPRMTYHVWQYRTLPVLRDQVSLPFALLSVLLAHWTPRHNTYPPSLTISYCL